MKKIIIILVMLLLVFGLIAQELDYYGIYIKTEIPESYESIKQLAYDKWGDNSFLVVEEINKQSFGLFWALTTASQEGNDEALILVQAAIKRISEGKIINWSIVWDKIQLLKKGE